MVVKLQFPVQGRALIIVILMKKLLFFIFLLAAPAFAETSGTLSFAHHNATSGLFGYVVSTCNSTADCAGYKCFLDYQGGLAGTSNGWCNQTTVTHCYHYVTEYILGNYSCISNVTYRRCESYGWSNVSNCTAGYTCNEGSVCTAASAPSSSSSYTNLNFTGSIIFLSFPSNFDIVQGNNATKTVVAKNNGNITLFNITLSVVGAGWPSANPAKVATLYRNGETTFTVSFITPGDAEIRPYQLTFVLATSNTTISATRPLVMTVKPSISTVQDQIYPDYTKYTILLEKLETNITNLGNKGVDVEELRNLLLNAKNKLTQTSVALEAKDYAAASQYLEDAKGLIDAINSEISSLAPPPIKIDAVLIVIIIVIIGAAALIVYLFLPPRPEEKKSLFDSFDKRRKKDESDA